MRLLAREESVTPEMLESKAVRNLVEEYARILTPAIIPALESSVIQDAMAERLKEDVFLFSGFKTYQGLKEASLLLRDNDGQVKSFGRFYNDITAIKEDYNKHWLKSEYQFAIASAQMAAKWKEFEEDADRYNQQYRTASDGKVRPLHKVLHGTTLPFSDPFWNEYFPPNGWRCRCTVVQVRKGKCPVSNSNTAIQQGREATHQANAKGENRAAIFRFNPGKQSVIFPPHHPYYEMSQREREAVLTALHPEAKDFITHPTENGRVRIHVGHGKNEKQENIRVADYFANKYGYEIDLLPQDNERPCADTYNRTLGYEEEYKVNSEPTVSAIDNAIRSAKRQADRIVLWIDSDISCGDITKAMKSRVERAKNIQSITVVMNGKDHTYTRENILSDSFKIQQADLY